MIDLICGDCLSVLLTLASGSVDAVITDPPYNVGCAYDEHNDAMSAEDYEAWCATWFAECQRVAKRVVIFPGHGNLGMWHRIAQPSGIGCWFKPGNPAKGGVFQFCEWEPFLIWGGSMAQSDVIRATVSKQGDTGAHPCPKPLSLLTQLLERMPKAESILDPFMGTGTTGVACYKRERDFIGIEKSPEYFAIAKRRIEQAQMQPQLALTG